MCSLFRYVGNYDFSVAAVADAEKSVMADKWGVVELSALASLHWAEVHNSFNHRDHKYVMYGNKEAGPISFHMNVKEGRKPGVVLLCEVNIDFGVVPAGFAHMRPHSKEKPEVVDIDVYYTLNVPQTDFKKTPFVFDKGLCVSVRLLLMWWWVSLTWCMCAFSCLYCTLCVCRQSA